MRATSGLKRGILTFPVCVLMLIGGCQSPPPAPVSTGQGRWNMWVTDGRATLLRDNNRATVTVTEPGSLPWSIGLYQAGLPVEKGKVYKVEFAASSDAGLRVEASVGMSRRPGYGYSGPRFFTLDPVVRKYSFTFTMRQDSDREGRHMFNLGHAGIGKLIIDDIGIACLGEAPADTIPRAYEKPGQPGPARGIQFGLQLAGPYEGAYGPELREEYFDLIKKDGRIDNIRLPVWWEYHTGKEPPYAIEPEFLKRVDWAVSNSLARGFFTILNMHWFRALESDPARHKVEYLAVWGQIAEYFRDYPDWLYFDILNEPNGNLDAQWNHILVECYDLIRRTNPDRTIVISGPFWAHMDHIPRLVLPDRIKADPHVLIQFHPYVPGDFCFQGSPGNSFADRRGIRWQGTRTEKDAIIRQFDAMEAWAARNNRLRLFNGEFGAHAAPPVIRGSLREDRLRWVRFIRDECEQRGIPWNYYDFCEDGTKLYDIATGAWDKELMNTLYGD